MAETACLAAVFAQLITTGNGGRANHGVHCFLVPIRDDDGNDLPGVTTSDCLYKGGLPGADNGRIMFDHVRIPRVNLLNRYGDVAPDGTYSSPIENASRRFFTMIDTLIRGRVTVGGGAAAAARVALDSATRYALQRRQFSAPDDDDSEVLIIDYLVHQRRLFPLIARSYALQFAQNELVSRCHDLQTADDPDAEELRELEARAAGLKAANTWHTSRAIQEAREACGGAGYMAEEGSLFNRGPQVKMFEDREEYLLSSVARRLQSKSNQMSAFDAFNAVQDHVLHAAQSHIDRVVLEAFVAGIESCPDREAREVLEAVCDLYALSVIEDDKACYIEHRFLSTERAKAVTRGINDRCRVLRPHAKTWWTASGSPNRCATPRCCIRRTCPTELSDRPTRRLPAAPRARRRPAAEPECIPPAGERRPSRSGLPHRRRTA